MIRLSSPSLVGREREYVLDCLDREELSSVGCYVSRFEAEFAKFTDSNYAVACCNGTAALHLAILSTGIRPGDKVLLPALTYVATANAVRYCGGIPIFCDVDPKTWCIDPNDVIRHLKAGVKATIILPVHLYGVVCDMTALGRIAKAYGCFLIEDAAEAHGAEWEGHRVGGVSDLGVFSFYGNKLVSSGEGGMVVTDSVGANEVMRLHRGQGVSAGNRYYHSVIGYNYRLTNIQAAIALGQLETLGQRLVAHKRIGDYYRARLSEFETQDTYENTTRVDWLFALLVPEGVDRDRVAERMKEKGIETRPVFIPMTQLPMYMAPTPENAQRIASRGLCLPTHAGLSEEDLESVVSGFQEAVQ